MDYNIFKTKFLDLWNNSSKWGEQYSYNDESGDFTNVYSGEIISSPSGINSISSLVNGAILCVKHYNGENFNDRQVSKREALAQILVGRMVSISEFDYEGKSYWSMLKDIYNRADRDTKQYVTWWKVTFDDENANTWFSYYGYSDVYYNGRKYYNESGELIGQDLYEFWGPMSCAFGPGSQMSMPTLSGKASPIYARMDTIGKIDISEFELIRCNVEAVDNPPFEV